MGMLWESYESPMGMLWEMLWECYMRILWECYGNAVGILWEFPHKSCGNGMGMKIPFLRQPWYKRRTSLLLTPLCY